MRAWFVWLVLGSVLFAGGCGGGGGGGGDSSATSSSGATAASVSIPSAGASPADNVLPIAVNSGPTGSVNLAFASMSVCAPGSTTACQTVDAILIDTGSTGLRILASALGSVALTQQTDASGSPIAECAQFADGSTWGPVKTADVKIAGKQASGLAIQVIGDTTFAGVPRACLNTGRTRNTQATLGANGILGIGSFQRDCGTVCARSTSPGIYYACPATGCVGTVRALADQVQHPAAAFAADNNGVIVQLPSLTATGAAGAGGTVTFGIGTQANNALGTTPVYTLDPLTGRLVTFYKGRTLANSFIDSGSNAYFFQDSSIAVCGNPGAVGFYCPAAPLALSATIQGANGNNVNIDFGIANAVSLFAAGGTAFNNLGSPLSGATSFDWGLPFFYGRKVFVAVEGASIPGAPAAPFIAF